MSPREDLEQFMTDESRALVAQFMADTADEDDDVDMDEVVRQNLADHEAALAGKQPKTRPGHPALPKNPKPTVGYIVVCPGWDPRDRQDSIDLWNQHPTVKAAQDSVEYSKLVGSSRTVIVRVDTTFTIVDGGGCDG